MKYFQLITITHILARTEESEMVTLSNKQVRITLHNYIYTWNDAQRICLKHGGKLFVEDAAERSIVLSNFRSNWNSNNNYWMGLHYPALGVNDVYGWTNCFWLSFYDNWESASEPSNSIGQRCVLTTTSGWKTATCDAEKRFVCETLLGDCTFSERTGFPNTAADFSPLSITTVNQSVCEERCLNKLHMNKNCWGANFNSSSSSQNCILYFTDDPFYFNTSATYDTSEVSMSIKNCYIDERQTNDQYEDNNDSTIPSNVCPSYVKQTTTTSTASPLTSTNTTTTTTAPTTTTSSTATTTPTLTTTSKSTSPTTTTMPTPTAATTQTTGSATSSILTTTPTITTIPADSTASNTPITTPASTSASLTTTSSLLITTTSMPTCQCNCANISNVLGNYTSDPDWANMTLDEKVEDIVTKLRIDKTNLSSYVRKKTSAPDERVVSKSLGYLGMFFISIVFGILIVSDGINFIADLKRKRGISTEFVLQRHVGRSRC